MTGHRVVGVQGLEPRIAEPETAVLPITPHPTGQSDCIARLVPTNPA